MKTGIRGTRVWRAALTLTLAPTALLIGACGSSAAPADLRSPPASVAACVDGVPTDQSATSLPRNVVPLPGPSVLYAAPPRAPQLENTGVWTAAPILISGASAYRCGEFVYQDWIYDDHGAAGVADPNDPQSPRGYLFSPQAGTATYPTDPVYANNAADLVEFRVKPLSDATAFRVTLNTLQDIDRIAFTVALGSSAAVIDWPHAANVASPAGWFLTVHGTTAELIQAENGTPVLPAPTVSIDLERRQVEVRVAHAAWNPVGESVRIALGLGLWDVDEDRYLQLGEQASASTPGGAGPAGAALFNLAFRAQEPLPDFSVFSGRTIADAAALSKAQAHWWRERAQADALQLGDVSEFFAEVDFSRLAQGVNDESGVPQSGFLNRIHASRYVFGQGIDHRKACGGISAARPCDGAMVGQLQPYALYVPDRAAPAGGYGLTLLLHALSANYNQYLGSTHAQQLGDRGAGTLVMTPAARGPDGFYFDVAEADVFEVWADVARHYPLDPDWVAMSGVSMGGIGSFRIGTRYPDLFARVMPIVATSGVDVQLPSLRNVPITMWTSTLDELQPVVSTEQDITAIHGLGYRLDSLRFDNWDHLTPSTNDSYGPGVDFLGEARVERDPARVTYVLAPAQDEARVDMLTQGAYWVSDLALRDTALATGSIDVRSAGFGLAEAAVIPVAQSSGVLEEGNHAPSPYTRRVLEWAAPAAAAAQDRLAIQATNIARVTINPSRARVSCNALIEVESDGPLAVTLSGC